MLHSLPTSGLEDTLGVCSNGHIIAKFSLTFGDNWGFPSGSEVKNLPEMQEMYKTQLRSLGWEDSLEEGMATHSSIFA